MYQQGSYKVDGDMGEKIQQILVRMLTKQGSGPQFICWTQESDEALTAAIVEILKVIEDKEFQNWMEHEEGW